MSSFITEHRERFGVEPICSTLEVSASAYYERRTGRRSPRAIEDELLLARIWEVHERNYCAYCYPSDTPLGGRFPTVLAMRHLFDGRFSADLHLKLAEIAGMSDEAFCPSITLPV